MENNKNIIYRPASKINKDTVTIYGCGKFCEETLTLDKIGAYMLVIELLTFLDKQNGK